MVYWQRSAYWNREGGVNLYLVVSEELSYIAVIDREIGGPLEYYWIAELVVARSHAQARYLAWKLDNKRTHNCWPVMADMPKFAVRLKEKDVEGPARVASDEYACVDWDDEKEYAAYDKLWDIGKAPHIGIGGED